MVYHQIFEVGIEGMQVRSDGLSSNLWLDHFLNGGLKECPMPQLSLGAMSQIF
jgi:hypothetical protein